MAPRFTSLPSREAWQTEVPRDVSVKLFLYQNASSRSNLTDRPPADLQTMSSVFLHLRHGAPRGTSLPYRAASQNEVQHDEGATIVAVYRCLPRWRWPLEFDRAATGILIKTVLCNLLCECHVAHRCTSLPCCEAGKANDVGAKITGHSVLQNCEQLQ